MELLLGYGAGLLTLINPCVLPVLPIVLASSLQAGKWGPVALASGMTLTFTVLGLTIAVIGRSFGLSDRLVTNSAAIAMQGMNAVAPDGLGGQFAGGALLGAVWSPCIGPTLGGAIALASQGGSLAAAGGVMLAFCAGVSSIMLMLAYGARSMLQRRRAAMQALAVRAKPIMGATFIIVAIAILSGLTQRIEGFAVTHLPFWLQDLSVSI
jgi:cytochrome c-type biogenesis protein